MNEIGQLRRLAESGYTIRIRRDDDKNFVVSVGQKNFPYTGLRAAVSAAAEWVRQKTAKLPSRNQIRIALHAKILELDSSGTPSKKIAADLNTTYSTVRSVLRKAGRGFVSETTSPLCKCGCGRKAIAKGLSKACYARRARKRKEQEKEQEKQID